MNSDDRELIEQLVKTNTAMAGALEEQAHRLKSLIASNAVLTMACGALYAEIARRTGDGSDLDAMLERLLSIMENQPDSEGFVLRTADEIRSAAEAMMG